MSVADLLFYPLYLILSYCYIELKVRKNQAFVSRSFLYSLFVYHLVFTVFYPLYYGNSIDSINYFNDAQDLQLEDLTFGSIGTSLINTLTFFVSRVIGLSYISSFFFFSFFGFMAFARLYVFISREILMTRFTTSHWWLYVLFFFPSFHLWSVLLGKDPLVLYGIVLTLPFLYKPHNLTSLFTFASGSLIVFLIRPHIAFALWLVTFLTIVLGSKRIKLFYRMGMILSSVFLGYLLIPFLLDYFGLSGNTLERYRELVERYSNFYAESRASVDMSHYSTGMKVFTFLFRPLFFDIPNPFAIITSAENLFLLILTLRMVFSKAAFYIIFRGNLIYRFAVMYTLVASLILINTGNNLGMFSRYRNVIIPFTILFIAGYIKTIEEKKR